jgi:5-methylcytosine-specific restriction endonuclease McrA
LPIEYLDIEHVQPKFCEGSSKIENLRLACGKCNSSKGVYTPMEWAWKILARYEKAEKEKDYCTKILTKLREENLI